jgi:hypothetical protein
VSGWRDEEQARIEKVARDLFSQTRGDAQRLATLAAQFKLAAAGRTGGTLEVVGIVSAESGKPIVQLSWGEQAGQISPEQARAHALLILEAAQNAVADAAILGWARDELGVDLERGAQLLDALRRYRTDRWGQPDLELEFGKPPADDAEGEEPAGS